VLGDEVALDVERGRHGVLVDIDLRDFDQVVTNAVLVLRDALPSGGLLTISTATIDASAAEADGRRVTPMALLIAAASGFGVREIAVPRALEETIGQQGGRLRVAHEPGRAVRLEIYFALVCASRVADVPPGDVQGEAPGTRSGSQWP
jgi:hypothetical protein